MTGQDGAEAPLLHELLARRAAASPGRPAYAFLLDGEEEAAELSYGELAARARTVAAALRSRLAPGERALLLFPPGLDFIVAFCGCLFAGVVAVPAYPPRPRKDQPRLRAIAGDASPAAVLTTAAVLARLEAERAELGELAAAWWLATDELAAGEGADALPAVDPQAPALLQYTSGSTATPKGVVVTHRNLAHNEAMIKDAFGQDASSVVVGWLPLYHDMGLIGNVLQPLFTGARAVLMSPMAFLQRPRRWLEAISRHRGTTSGGPNFAYELCLRKVPPAAREGLDLSSWRVAFNGAEPVRAATLERFAAEFAPCGFRREAFYPCYGLAEATLFVAGPERGRAPASATLDGRRLVGCGRPRAGQEVAVVDVASAEAGAAHECAPGAVGEVWVAGESVARGYWRRPEESAATFGARLADGRGPFLRTGDLGFAAAGADGERELFITGRLKDLIILRGRNHYPQDVELTAARSHPGLRPDGGAAFAVEAAGEERLVVVHEVERRPGDLAEIAASVRRAVAEEHEAQLYDVVLIKAGTLPKTSSGKVQRRACRALYQADALATVASSRLDAAAEAAEPGEVAAAPSGAALAEELAAAPLAQRPDLVLDWLATHAAPLLGGARPEPSRPLTALGLDSLAAVELAAGVEEALGVEVPLAELLAGWSLADLAADVARQVARQVEAAGATAAPAAPDLDDAAAGEQPASPGQAALWYSERLAPEGGVYNVAVAARPDPGFDAAAFRRAAARLAARHPALRTTFAARDGEPVQMVAETAAIDCESVGETLGPDRRDLQARLADEAYRPFDLERGPLWRWRLFAAAPEAGPEAAPTLLFVIHHLIADFWSLALLGRELGALYTAERCGVALDLGPPPPAYAAFARRQRARLMGEEGERLRAHWQERLGAGGGPADLELPTDRPRPPVQSFRGRARAATIAAPSAAALAALARAHDTTPFAVLLAAWQLHLGRLAGQRDFAIGAPTAGRERPFLATVGYFVSPVALRADLGTGLGTDPSFAELLARVRRTVTAALAHADLPLLEVVERLRPERDAARAPLFQAMVVWHAGRPDDDPALGAFALGEGGARLRLGELALTSVALAERRVPFDLTLRAAPRGGEIALALEHNADLFDAATAGRFLQQLTTLLAAAVADPGQRVSRLPLLTAAARTQLLVEWNDTASREAEAGSCLHELVAAQAAATPDAAALVAGEVRLTYGELAERATALAQRLRALGVGPEVRVGVCLERTAELVVTLLAVLEAGGAYVPLDPAYPRERLELLARDAGAAVVVTAGAAAATAAALVRPPARLVDLDRPEEPASAPAGARNAERGAERHAPSADHLAYVLYTSGSTGRPKGVAIPHRGPAALVAWARRRFAPAELAGVLAATSISFDLSVFEIFVPLACGGRVILAENALALPALPARAEVTLVNTVPSAMAELVRSNALPPGVRTVNLAGEPIPPALWQELAALPRVTRLFNLYGPSEDTTYSTEARLGAPPSTGAAGPPIGRPLAGGRLCLRDRDGEPVAIGVAGEVCLAGAGLARGYLDRPALTAARFVPEPGGVGARPGDRQYLTGDLARLRPDGVVDFLGRRDQQVKVRGFRIELGEVEARLDRLAGVAEAAVAVAPGGDALAAYVALAPGGEVAALAAELRRQLPGYMVPGVWVTLPALPRTPNGKVDRRALPAPGPAAASGPGAVSAATVGGAPRTPEEEVIAGLFRDLLGVDAGAGDSFFALGGHSLLAMRLVARLRAAFGVEVPVRTVLEAPTVAGLAQQVAAARHADRQALPVPQPRPAGESAPASFAQERLFFLHRLDPASAAYHMPAAVRLRGPLPLPVLAAALAAVARRQEVLRTTFASDGDVLYLRTAPPASAGAFAALPLVDLGALPPTARERELARRQRREARRPFDLERGPWWRATLVRLAAAEHVLLLTLHHVAADGWSLGVLGRELTALVAGRPLPPLPLAYADFAAWQRRQVAAGALVAEAAYWRERLQPEPPLLELPLDRPRPATQSFAGARSPFTLPRPLVEALRGLARRCDATLFMTLAAGLQTLLGRRAGERDVTVGTPVAGRDAVASEEVVGLFVNTLVLRLDLGGEPSFAQVLGRVREAALGAYAHAALPFEKVVEEVRPGRDLSSTPLFQVMLALAEEPPPVVALPGVASELLPASTGAARLDLTLFLTAADGALAGEWEYGSDLFDAATVRRLSVHFVNLLAAVAAEPSLSAWRAPLLSAGEEQQLQREWNDTAQRPAPPAGSCLHELVAAQAARTPEAEALVAGAERLTYRELEERANRLARRLRVHGVGPEARVGVCLERSARLVVSLLAVLKAGGAYVALDPAYPPERLAFLTADSGARLVVSSGSALPAALAELLATGDGARLFDLDAEAAAIGAASAAALRSSVGPDHLAYVLYTSGSTGRPKGVAIPHRGPAALLAWAAATFSPAELRGVLAATSVSFDLSVFELFAPLALGGRVVLAENALALPGLAARGEVTLVNTVPSAMAELLRAGALPPGVRTVNLAGEPISPALAAALVAVPTVTRALNLYGPSEDTTYSTGAPLPGAGTPPIGRPLAGGRAFVVDRGGELAPVGVAGELHLAGDGLARGYLDRPALTAGRFVPDRFFGAGGRLYRTGDLTRQRPDGVLDFLGRRDHQVKVRGYRIELGEVEAALARCPGVRDAAVVARPAAGGARLVGYLVLAGGGDVAAVRAHLGRLLPAPLVPGVWVTLPALPLTPNGKVDRRALPEPASAAAAAPRTSAPGTPLEGVLAELFATLLERQQVGVDDSFFDLGGHSLLAMRLTAAVRAACAVELPVRAVFEAPTVAALARRVAALRQGGAAAARPPIAPLPRPAGGVFEAPASFAQERLWFLHQLEPESVAYHIPAAVRLRGPLAVPALAAALAEVTRRHEALRTTFALGPDAAPVQRIAAAGSAPPLPVVDLGALAARDRRRQAGRVAAAAARQPFDLGRGPLLRTLLLAAASTEHTLVVVFHHIVSDGVSLEVLVQELGALYGRAASPEPGAVPADPPLQYADFAAWQRRWLTAAVVEREAAFWRDRLGTPPAVLELPTDRPRPAVRSTAGAACPVRVPAPLAGRLRAVGRERGATLFMTLAAAFLTVLYRYSGQGRLNLGTPVAGRPSLETERLIGLFVNTIVLSCDISRAPVFDDVVGRVREASLAAFAHADLPFERVVEALESERDPSRTPLFQAMFVLQTTRLTPRLPGLAAELLELGSGAAKLDLTLALSEVAGGALAGRLEHSAALFDRTTAARLVRSLDRTLAAVAADPARPLAEVALLSPAERHQLLAEWNDSAAAYGAASASTLHALFLAQVARSPEAVALTAVALTGDETRLCYRELAARATALAAELTALGVGPEVRVALLCERSLEMVVAVLGTLIAGGAYLPLDPEHPPARLAATAGDASPAVLLTQQELLPATAAFPGAVLAVDGGSGSDPLAGKGASAPASAVHGDTPAYVLYTSGSTGAPKGVMVPHRAIVNHTLWMQDLLPLGSDDRALQKTPYTFDASVGEMWAPLVAGAQLIMARPGGHRDAAYLVGELRRHRVTTLHLVPTLLRMLLAEPDFAACAGLARVTCGGEPLTRELAGRFAAHGPGAALYNLYGPTEVTIHTHTTRVSPAAGAVAIGRAVANVRGRVLDAGLRPLPLGAAGELYAAGTGLARGYFGRPGLTAERFLPDPFADAPGERLYRTGDLARYLTSGEVDCLGRRDQQVKVRGFRVELGEIEAALARCPEVGRGVVAVTGDGRLVAHLVAASAAASAAAIRSFVAAHLPEHMVPSAYVFHPELPVTSSGKVDRRALAAQGDAGAEPEAPYVAPRTPTEEAIAEVWQEVLGAPRVGAHDSFFALGGHSLVAAQAASRLAARLGVQLPLREIFTSPTVEALAEKADELLLESVSDTRLDELLALLEAQESGG